MADSILILGSNGMLGYGVSEYFEKKNYHVKKFAHKDFDAVNDDIMKLGPVIKEIDFAINCIGIIKPMIEMNSPLDVVTINGVFPRNLAKLCNLNGKPLIHITTDCAFTGKKGNYNENDFFDADDLYGTSKIAGETEECMTLRTSFVGPEKGTKRSLLEWAFSQKGNKIKGFTNHRWNGLSTIYFAETAERIFNNGLYRKGIFHIYSPDVVTKYELVSIFNEVFDLGMTIEPAEAAVSCDRSLSSIFDISSGLSTKTIKEQVTELKSFFHL